MVDQLDGNGALEGQSGGFEPGFGHEQGRPQPLGLSPRVLIEPFKVLNGRDHQISPVNLDESAKSGLPEAVFVLGLGKEVLRAGSELAADRIAMSGHRQTGRVARLDKANAFEPFALLRQLERPALVDRDGLHLQVGQQGNVRGNVSIDEFSDKVTGSVSFVGSEDLNRLIQPETLASERMFIEKGERRLPLGKTCSVRGRAAQDHPAFGVDQVVAQIRKRAALMGSLAIESCVRVGARIVCLIRVLLAMTLPGTFRLGLAKVSGARRLFGRRPFDLVITGIRPGLQALHARVGLDLGAVYRDVPTRDQPGRDALGEHLLEQTLKDITGSPALVAKTREGRVVGHRIMKVQPAEPAVARMHADLLTQLAIRQFTQRTDDHHTNRHLRIDGGSALTGHIAIGENLAHRAQIKHGIDLRSQWFLGTSDSRSITW